MKKGYVKLNLSYRKINDTEQNAQQSERIDVKDYFNTKSKATLPPVQEQPLASKISVSELFQPIKKKAHFQKFVLSVILSVVSTGLIVSILFGVVFGVAVVNGISMEPTLHNSDLVVFFRLQSNYDIGDIVVVNSIADRQHIKRVVATPHQTVNIDSETLTLYVDGEKQDLPYINQDTIPKTGCTYPLTLQDNEYFLLGDYRENSFDSRNYGAVQKSQISGKVILTFSTSN